MMQGRDPVGGLGRQGTPPTRQGRAPAPLPSPHPARRGGRLFKHYKRRRRSMPGNAGRRQGRH
eukprot:9071090-Alexandrium_andersonii.AAC.1